MDAQAIQLPRQNHQAVLNRFVAACQADERVVAATLYGSYARGAADAYSDLDIGLITTDAAYGDFVAGREAFMRLLGEPVFLEDFDLPNIVFFVFLDGTEGELSLGRESQFNHNHGGPYRVLLDKRTYWRGPFSPGTNLRRPSRSRRCAAWSTGSGMTCPTSPRLWDAGSYGGRMVS
jgi:predicted nucleotidyltransferase